MKISLQAGVLLGAGMLTAFSSVAAFAQYVDPMQSGPFSSSYSSSISYTTPPAPTGLTGMMCECSGTQEISKITPYGFVIEQEEANDTCNLWCQSEALHFGYNAEVASCLEAEPIYQTIMLENGTNNSSTVRVAYLCKGSISYNDNVVTSSMTPMTAQQLCAALENNSTVLPHWDSCTRKF